MEAIKVILAIIAIYLMVMIVFFVVDSSNLKNAKEPIFSKKTNENEIESGATYQGIGYSLESYKDNHVMHVKGKILFIVNITK